MSKTDAKTVKYLYFRESALQSILSDLGTFSILMSSFYFNYRFIGNSWFINSLILIFFLLYIFSKAKNKAVTYTDKEKLIKDLQKEDQL